MSGLKRLRTQGDRILAELTLEQAVIPAKAGTQAAGTAASLETARLNRFPAFAGMTLLAELEFRTQLP